MLETLKEKVYQANLNLQKHNLVIFTWGNVSAIDENREYIVIKPSGVKYEDMKASDMVVVNMNGEVEEGNLKPSSDTLTHLELYRKFSDVKSVVHTHSKWATTFAQMNMPIVPLGTTHADYFEGEIPVTRLLSKEEIENDYEWNTGKVIAETFEEKKINPLYCPAVLVHEHGPFTWGDSLEKAVHNAVVLEFVAEMAYRVLLVDNQKTMSSTLHKKHFYRKHGENKYYGQ